MVEDIRFPAPWTIHTSDLKGEGSRKRSRLGNPQKRLNDRVPRRSPNKQSVSTFSDCNYWRPFAFQTAVRDSNHIGSVILQVELWSSYSIYWPESISFWYAKRVHTLTILLSLLFTPPPSPAAKGGEITLWRITPKWQRAAGRSRCHRKALLFPNLPLIRRSHRGCTKQDMDSSAHYWYLSVWIYWCSGKCFQGVTW